MRPSAVFLDRDGVINRKAPEGEYVTRWAEFEFLPGVLEALRVLARGRAPVIVVTNQRGIALGRMTETDLADIHARMRAAVTRAGGRIDAVYHCPHRDGCRCRKPAPGLLLDAARNHTLDLRRAVMVGDRAYDMEAGRAVGARCVMVADAESAPVPGVDHRARDLLDAVDWMASRAPLE